MLALIELLFFQDEDSGAYEVEIDLDELLDIEGDFNRKEWLGVSNIISFYYIKYLKKWFFEWRRDVFMNKTSVPFMYKYFKILKYLFIATRC